MQQDCLIINSTLVTIHNDVENAIIQGLAVAYDAPALLGLHDLHDNGTYAWSDGSMLDYQNWHDQPGADDCIFLRIESMKWYPLNCSSFGGMNVASEICQVPAIS